MSHAQKILTRMSKKTSQPRSTENHELGTLREQYDIIRQDLIKLKEDLQKGFEVAKGTVNRKTLINQFLKSK